MATSNGVCSPALLEQASRDDADTSRFCGAGWPQFWAVVLLISTTEVLGGVVFPGVATVYYNGGTDPCVGSQHESQSCKDAVAKVASTGSFFTLIGSILAFFCGPFVGMLCDLLGRKPVLLFSVLLSLMKAVSLLAVDIFTFSIYWYFCLAVAVGVVPLALSSGLWITDRTRPSQRVGLFALLIAATDLEAVVVPNVSALASSRTCLSLAVLCGLAALLITGCCFVESLPRHQRQATLQHARFGSNLSLACQRKYRVLTFLVLVANTVHAGCTSIYLLFLKVHFGATLKDISPVIFLSGMSNLLVQVFVVKRLGACVGLKNTILIGFFFGAWNCGIMCLAPNYHWLYVSVFTSGLGVIFTPAIQAFYMNITNSQQRGAVQGALTSLVTLTGGLGPVLFSSLLVFFETPRFGLSHEATYAPYVLTILSNCLCSLVVVACLRSDKGGGSDLDDAQPSSNEMASAC